MDHANKARSIKLHFFYIVLILSLAIVGLVTNHWTKLQGFTDYLNVAATVISVVLGLLAIIYAFVSTGTMNQFLGSIQSSTVSMNQVAIEMRETLTTGQGIQARADTRTEELHLLAQDLATALASLDESTKNLTGKVDSIPTQLTALQESITSAATSSQTVAGAGEADLWTNDHISNALKGVSQYGIAALKGVSLAKEKRMYLDVAKRDGLQLFMYGYGYLVALQAAGLIKLEYPGKKADLHSVRLLSGPDGLEALIEAEWALRKENPKKAKYIAAKESLFDQALHDGSSYKDTE